MGVLSKDAGETGAVKCWGHRSGEEVARKARGDVMKETGFIGVNEADREIGKKVVDFVSSISYGEIAN